MPRGTPGRIRATCHPNEWASAHGLCKKCARKKLAAKRETAWVSSNGGAATCHPNRKEKARGLCRSCYRQKMQFASDSSATSDSTFNRQRNYSLMANYGINVATYEVMLAKQSGLCKICKSSNPGGHGKYFNVDHCHKTKQVRGLLCQSCNTGLGGFRDNTALMQEAMNYLKSFREWDL